MPITIANSLRNQSHQTNAFEGQDSGSSWLNISSIYNSFERTKYSIWIQIQYKFNLDIELNQREHSVFTWNTATIVTTNKINPNITSKNLSQSSIINQLQWDNKSKKINWYIIINKLSWNVAVTKFWRIKSRIWKWTLITILTLTSNAINAVRKPSPSKLALEKKKKKKEK